MARIGRAIGQSGDKGAPGGDIAPADRPSQRGFTGTSSGGCTTTAGEGRGRQKEGAVSPVGRVIAGQAVADRTAPEGVDGADTSRVDGKFRLLATFAADWKRDRMVALPAVRDSGFPGVRGVAVRKLPSRRLFPVVWPESTTAAVVPHHPMACHGKPARHPGAFSATCLFATADRVILESDNEDTTPRHGYFTAAPALLSDRRPRMR